MVASKTERHELLGGVLDQGLKGLGYPREDLNEEMLQVTRRKCWTSTAAKGGDAATNFTAALSVWPTGTPASVNWEESCPRWPWDVAVGPVLP